MLSFSSRFPILLFTAAAAAATLAPAGCRTVPDAGTAAPLAAVSGEIADDEAARLALVNNPAFRELMTDFGIAEADLIQAREWPNPGLAVLFPLGPKQLEFAAKLPVESLWLRPQRMAIAKLNTEAIGIRLVQDGLNLVRDVKVACADLRLAERRVQLARDEADLLTRFADLADARLQAGDISELEVTTAETDAMRARIDRDRAPLAVKLAREKLRNLLGVSNENADFSLAAAPRLPALTQSEEAMLKKAFAARPDLRAAELAIETEGKRVGLAASEIFQLTAVYDANGDGANFESGPGLELILPIFNQNQGARALADAKFQKATRHYLVVRDQIALEVRQALARCRQAEEHLQSLRNELLPAQKRTIEQTERAWEGGEVSYLFVLESTRQVQAARISEAESLADWQRAAAELERSVGSPTIAASVEGNLNP